MKEDSKNEILNIENIIYVIRGKEVMLDSDLAKLYECKNGTKTINQAISRHKDRFPNDFYFQVANDEYEDLKSQIGTSSWNNYGGIRKLPHVFTEQGVAMLATVLKTNIASEISINIMRAFVKMRHFLIDNKDIYKSLTNLNLRLSDTEDKVDKLFSKFDKKEYLYLENSEFDAYSDIIKILKTSKQNIIIVDPYVDITFLDTIRNIKPKVTLITQRRTRLTKTEIDKYNTQYNNLTVIKNSSFHDRYLIIDNQDIYHLGASINYAGDKVFSINKLQDEDIITLLKDKVNKIIEKKKATT